MTNLGVQFLASTCSFYLNWNALVKYFPTAPAVLPHSHASAAIRSIALSDHHISHKGPIRSLHGQVAKEFEDIQSR